VLGIFTAYTLKKLKAQKSQLFNKIQAAQSQSQMSFKPLWVAFTQLNNNDFKK
jgi:hypothetical protein